MHNPLAQITAQETQAEFNGFLLRYDNPFLTSSYVQLLPGVSHFILAQRILLRGMDKQIRHYATNAYSFL